MSTFERQSSTLISLPTYKIQFQIQIIARSIGLGMIIYLTLLLLVVDSLVFQVNAENYSQKVKSEKMTLVAYMGPEVTFCLPCL